MMAAYIRNAGQAPDERDNDGLVSVASASWNPLAEAPWPADHLGEVGHSLTPPDFVSSFPHLEALRQVIMMDSEKPLIQPYEKQQCSLRARTQNRYAA